MKTDSEGPAHTRAQGRCAGVVPKRTGGWLTLTGTESPVGRLSTLVQTPGSFWQQQQQKSIPPGIHLTCGTIRMAHLNIRQKQTRGVPRENWENCKILKSYVKTYANATKLEGNTSGFHSMVMLFICNLLGYFE